MASVLVKMASLLASEGWRLFVLYFALPSCILLVLAILVTGIYNRYFHALSGIPGPFWGSVTKLYLVYMISSVPIKGLELHRRYGEPHYLYDQYSWTDVH